MIRWHKDKKLRREIVSWAITIALAISLPWATTTYAFQATRIEQLSMFPTIHDGDIVFLSKLSYLGANPKRGDIIIFEPPYKSDKALIKRVIGLPGEWMSFENGQILINGKIFVENNDHTKTDYGQIFPKVQMPQGTRLGDDEYYVTGDNRDVSYDSRAFGPIKRNEIIGKALCTLWPVNHIGLVK